MKVNIYELGLRIWFIQPALLHTKVICMSLLLFPDRDTKPPAPIAIKDEEIKVRMGMEELGGGVTQFVVYCPDFSCDTPTIILVIKVLPECFDVMGID